MKGFMMALISIACSANVAQACGKDMCARLHAQNIRYGTQEMIKAQQMQATMVPADLLTADCPVRSFELFAASFKVHKLHITIIVIGIKAEATPKYKRSSFHGEILIMPPQPMRKGLK